MAEQQYIVRWFNPSLYQKPVYDRYGRMSGGNTGWREDYVYGQRAARKSCAELSLIFGKANVNFEAFNDPVQSPYKRRPNRKIYSKRRDEHDDFAGYGDQ